jgi:hypothetical protein
LIQFCRLNGINHSALPIGLRRASLAGFGTWAYAGPIHADPTDSLWTMGFRFHRGEKEPETAYHLCLVEAQLEGCDTKGTIIMQPTGSMAIWRGKMDLHGSSIDVRESKEQDEQSSIGCVLTQKPLMLNQTLRFMDQIVEIAHLEDLREQEFIRSKLGIHEFEDLAEHYQGMW